MAAKVSSLPNLSFLTFCCCDKDHGIKQLMEDRTYSSYSSGSQGITERNQGRSSRQDLEAETKDKSYLLAHSQGDIQLAFLDSPEPPVHRWHPERAGPSYIN